MRAPSAREPGREPTAGVVRHRHLVRGALVATALLFSLAIPGLEMRFAPEELVAPDDDATRASASMLRDFGPDEDVILVLVDADDVLAPDVLGWSHRMARFLQEQPGIARVESLGTTALPRAMRDDEVTLDALDSASPEEDARRVRAEDAITAAVESDPVRFPAGLMSLAERGRGPIEVAPIVAGDEVTEAERRAIETIVEESALIRGRLISANRRVLVIAAILATAGTEDEVTRAVEATLARLSDVPPPAGTTARLAGLAVMRVTMVSALRTDQVLLISLASLGSVLVLLIGMRSAVGVVLPMSVVGITLAITMGAMALAGEPINLLTNVIPPLLVTIGLSDAVHLVLRYRDELRAGAPDGAVAASRTLRAMWRPCFVTAFTTAIGFAALLVAGTPILMRFGTIAALATMVSYAVTVLFVPASLPSFRGDGARPGSAVTSGARGLDRVVIALARGSARRPWWTIGGATGLLLGSLVLSRGIEVDSRLLDQFAPDSEIADVTRSMERDLDGVRGLSIGIEAAPGHFLTPAGIAELEQLTRWLREQRGVLRATTHADWLHEAWSLVTGEAVARDEAFRSEEQVRALRALVASGGGDPVSRFVTDDGARARIEVRLADTGASRILAMAGRFEERAGELAGARVTFSGEAWDASRGLERIVDSLGGLASAVVMIFVVMTVLFRSVRLGILSIPPNALPLAMTLAYMALRGIPLHAATVIVFTVTVGLAVDGATHVIARFREESEAGGPVEEVLIRAMATSGRGVVLSAATLLIGYFALLFSAFEPVRLFGELSAVAIGAALLSQLVLLPALLAVGAPRTKPLPEPALEVARARRVS